MVKNNGGSKTKSQARKLVTGGDRVGPIRMSTSDDEKYALVTKMLGNGMCYINTYDGLTLLCHIRNKFRGRSKRNNFIGMGSYVLIGMREWESTPKNCDLLEVYDDDSVIAAYFPNNTPSDTQNNDLLFHIDTDIVHSTNTTTTTTSLVTSNFNIDDI
jgi:translation initiation factor IF-1